MILTEEDIPLKICVLMPSFANSEVELRAYDTATDLHKFLKNHDYEMVEILKAKSVIQIRELLKKKFDVYINMCDGSWDEDTAGIDVVYALEREMVPFTGAASPFYDPSREEMKLVCNYQGIETPAYFFAKDQTDIEMAAKFLNFPMIVKHPNSYSSIGMTKKSKVANVQELREESLRMIDAFGEVLIEEFITGREFTVLVAENPVDPNSPVAFQPVEFVFPEGEDFKHFDMKWIDYASMSCKPCRDPELSERLKDMSRKLFNGFKGSGYGRCDIRMSLDGRLYMLEINPNCGIFYPEGSEGSADFILQNDPAGQQGFMNLILKAAFNRVKFAKRKWRILNTGKSRYGIYAIDDIEIGETIEVKEEKSHNLVSRSHVIEQWNDQLKEWFHQTAYPISDEIWVTWSERPNDWMPLNHSCNPNSWLTGLNVTARRKIKKGEEITIDVATYCNENMEPFECQCGDESCRGRVEGTDYKKEFMKEFYGHTSDYIRNKIKQLR